MSRSVAVLALFLVLEACAIQGAPRRGDELFARVQAGMPQPEVRAILGPPDNTMAFPSSRTDSWGYFYWDDFGYYVEASVTFAADGRVVSKAKRRLNDGGDMK